MHDGRLDDGETGRQGTITRLGRSTRLCTSARHLAARLHVVLGADGRMGHAGPVHRYGCLHPRLPLHPHVPPGRFLLHGRFLWAAGVPSAGGARVSPRPLQAPSGAAGLWVDGGLSAHRPGVDLGRRARRRSARPGDGETAGLAGLDRRPGHRGGVSRWHPPCAPLVLVLPAADVRPGAGGAPAARAAALRRRSRRAGRDGQSGRPRAAGRADRGSAVLAARPGRCAHPRPDLRPDPLVLLAYGTPFAFGWLLHRQQELLGRLARRWWAYLALGMAAGTIPLVITLRMSAAGNPALPASAVLPFAATYALGMVFLSLGFTGTFLRWLSRPVPAIRYLSDAAYWLYIAHLPLVAALQVACRDRKST